MQPHALIPRHPSNGTVGAIRSQTVTRGVVHPLRMFIDSDACEIKTRRRRIPEVFLNPGDKAGHERLGAR